MSSGYLAKKRAPAYIVGTASGPAEFHYSKPDSCTSSTKFFDDEDAWTSSVAGGLTAGTCYEVCGSKVKTGLCDKRLLKGGLLLDKWDMTDDGAADEERATTVTSKVVLAPAGKKGGGADIVLDCEDIELESVRQILSEYKIHNVEMLIREDVTQDEVIDVVLGNRKYVRCLYVYNKVDSVTIEDVDRLARLPHTVVMSVHMDLNIDGLLEKVSERVSE